MDEDEGRKKWGRREECGDETWLQKMRGDVRGKGGGGRKEKEGEMVKIESERYIRILSIAQLSDAEAVGD